MNFLGSGWHSLSFWHLLHIFHILSDVSGEYPAVMLIYRNKIKTNKNGLIFQIFISTIVSSSLMRVFSKLPYRDYQGNWQSHKPGLMRLAEQRVSQRKWTWREKWERTLRFLGAQANNRIVLVLSFCIKSWVIGNITSNSCNSSSFLPNKEYWKKNSCYKNNPELRQPHHLTSYWKAMM